jgi:tRNA(Ile)-lysidine synthetase-like protein
MAGLFSVVLSAACSVFGWVHTSLKGGDSPPVRYIVAVSGGVDSVVLLDILAGMDDVELIVAHFDHGIRDDSAADARFVEELAKEYQLPFVTRREELGAQASEERARDRRYAFLRDVARDHDAKIVTAHHADDLVETIAINLMRGTGWRGLAVLDAPDIHRPLLRQTKQDIYNYALHNRLEWVEDSTNGETQYLRNRLRQVINAAISETDKQAICELWRQQITLKVAIDEEARQFLRDDHTYSRYVFIQSDAKTACELLRAALLRATGESPTRPQTERALLAIKAARTNTQYEVSGRTRLRFTTSTFIVETP